MANEEHLAMLRKGPEAWHRWRERHADVVPDLSAANLSGANLVVANLREAKLSRADLSGANLVVADLSGAQLSEAKLSRANLSGSILSGANLVVADLSGSKLLTANLSEANLSRADLSKADLHKAKLWETVFANANLSGVKGLDTCEHEGPSTLDHRTIARSGPLPLVFLRGCGLPDVLIDYLPSLLNQPIQFYSCFISYSAKDQEFAERLHADLQNKGVRCWFDRHDMQGGRKIHEQIDEAIRRHDRLLLIISQDSIERLYPVSARATSNSRSGDVPQDQRQSSSSSGADRSWRDLRSVDSVELQQAITGWSQRFSALNVELSLSPSISSQSS
jgi:hypothetical protein